MLLVLNSSLELNIINRVEDMRKLLQGEPYIEILLQFGCESNNSPFRIGAHIKGLLQGCYQTCAFVFLDITNALHNTHFQRNLIY